MAERMIIGGVIAALCLFGLWHGRWLLAETRKGQRLAGWLGRERGLLVLRVLLGTGVILGVLLATGVLRPVRW